VLGPVAPPRRTGCTRNAFATAPSVWRPELTLTQPHGDRRRRSRHRKGGPKPVEATPAGNGPLEDPRTFWERSNARLGVEAIGEDPSGRRRGRGPVEYPCAVCGTMVMMDRWPKHRHEVRCEPCRATVSSMLVDDDDTQPPATRGDGAPPRPAVPARLEGLPEMTAEDLEALAEIRANRGGGEPVLTSAGGARGRRRRTGPMPGVPGGGKPRREGGEPRQARRGGGGAPNGGGDKAEGEGGGRRKRRRRRGGAPGEAVAAEPTPSGEN
jgi:hypothetical protein